MKEKEIRQLLKGMSQIFQPIPQCKLPIPKLFAKKVSWNAEKCCVEIEDIPLEDVIKPKGFLCEQ